MFKKNTTLHENINAKPITLTMNDTRLIIETRFKEWLTDIVPFYNNYKQGVVVEHAKVDKIIYELVGRPGIGKSQMIRQFAEDMKNWANQEFGIDVDFKFMMSSYAKGSSTAGMEIPDKVDDEIRSFNAIPHYAPIPDKITILFADEKSDYGRNAKQLIQMVTDNDSPMWGSNSIPFVFPILASNGSEFTNTAMEDTLALKNRISVLKVDIDASEWVEWAISNRISKDMIGFVLTNPDAIESSQLSLNYKCPLGINYTDENNVFVSARSIEQLSHKIHLFDNKEVRDVVILGKLGEVYGQKLIDYLDNKQHDYIKKLITEAIDSKEDGTVVDKFNALCDKHNIVYKPFVPKRKLNTRLKMKDYMYLIETDFKDFVKTGHQLKLCILGKSGLGKTAILNSIFTNVAKKQNFVKKSINMSSLSSINPAGFIMPEKKGDGMYEGRTVLPSYAPSTIGQKNNFVIIDEIMDNVSKRDYAKVALLQQLTDSTPSWAEFELSNTYIVATGNDANSSMFHEPLSPPVRDRLTLINVEVDVEYWIQYAMKKGVDERIIGFINDNRNLLTNPPRVEELDEHDNFVSARSLMKLDKVVKTWDNPKFKRILDAEIIACIGCEHGNKFISYLKHVVGSITPEQLLADNKMCKKYKFATLSEAMLFTYQFSSYIKKHHIGLKLDDFIIEREVVIGNMTRTLKEYNIDKLTDEFKDFGKLFIFLLSQENNEIVINSIFHIMKMYNLDPQITEERHLSILISNYLLLTKIRNNIPIEQRDFIVNTTSELLNIIK